MGVNLWILVPNLLCSTLSFIATTIFGLLNLYFPPPKHYRQALVCNLLVAGWINSLNNTVSGSFALHSALSGAPDLSPGPGCEANAWIGQFSVQAIDFNILAIALSVFLILRSDTILFEPSTRTVSLVCLATWIPSIITSNIALGLNLYGPVSGNWCWITSNYLGLRYALTHGWRVMIFFVIVAIYIWLYRRLRKLFEEPTAIASRSSDPSRTNQHSRSRPATFMAKEGDMKHMLPDPSQIENDVNDGESFEIETDCQSPGSVNSIEGRIAETPSMVYKEPTSSTLKFQEENDAPTVPHYSRHKILLLSGYPVFYVILWIPGIANRIVEAVGTTPVWLTALQATTQLVPLANTLTYMYNERMSSHISAWFRRGCRERGAT